MHKYGTLVPTWLFGVLEYHVKRWLWGSSFESTGAAIDYKTKNSNQKLKKERRGSKMRVREESAS